MPQMFPLMWTILFSSVSLMLLVMMSLIFFMSKPYSSLNIPNQLNPHNSSWKW